MTRKIPHRKFHAQTQRHREEIESSSSVVILDLGFVRHGERDGETCTHTRAHTHTCRQEELEFAGGEIFASALLGTFGNGERSWEEGGKRSHGGRDSVQNFCFGQLSSSRNREQLGSCLFACLLACL